MSGPDRLEGDGTPAGPDAEWRRLPNVPRKNLRAEVDDELRFHLDTAVQELIARGVSPAEARVAALERFGRLDDVRSACLTIDQRRDRRRRRGDLMSAFLQDLRYAFRSVRSSPGFTVIVVLTLALAIGANTALFSVLDAVVLKPLPYPASERLVAISDIQRRVSETPASYPEFIDWRTGSGTAFTRIGGYFVANFTLTEGGEPVVLNGARMSAEVPSLLGTKPIVGRHFRPDEENVGAERVVMLSERVWRERFSADRAIVGRTIQLSGNPWIVIGVFPSEGQSTLPSEFASSRKIDVWAPLRLDETRAPRSLHFMHVFASVRPELTFEAARQRMSHHTMSLRRSLVTTHDARLTPLPERVVGDVSSLLTILLVSVGFVLLIGCANVANLLLGRAAAREREISVRMALGAERWRVVAQLLTESLVRALLGGMVGIGFAYLALAGFRRFLPTRLPRFDEISVDTRVLAFAFVVSIITGLLFGTLPAWRASRSNVVTGLREGGRGVFGSLRRDRTRGALVTAEIALSFVLLVGAGLLLQSLRRIMTAPRGFDSEQLVTAYLGLPASRYPDSTRRFAFFDRLLASANAAPGLTGVAITTSLPIEGGVNGGVVIEGVPSTEENRPIAEKRVVSTNYFDVMGARLLKGRFFNARDRAGATPVVIVNESFVRRWLPNIEPIGHRVDFSWETTGLQTIAGVVADLKERELSEPAVAAIYIPITQRAADGGHLVARTTLDAGTAIGTLGRTVRELDPALPLSAPRTFADIIGEGTGQQRLSATLLTVFSAIALILAAVGLYGVISFAVMQRTQEIGIRAAVGAQQGDIIRLILGQGMRYAIGGLMLGGIGAYGATRVLQGQLVGISATDPWTFAGVAILLAAVALLASAIPARRASRVDPVVALRQE